MILLKRGRKLFLKYDLDFVIKGEYDLPKTFLLCVHFFYMLVDRGSYYSHVFDWIL